MNLLDRLRPSTISWHILKSYLPPFIVGVSFFSFVILLFNLRFAIKAAIEKGVDVGLVLDLVVYSMGWTLSLTVPMSAILGTIISVSTLNADQEIIAMRAGGMTFFRIFRPYFMFSFLLSLFMVWYQFEVIPICSRGMNTLTLAIYNYNPTAVIEPGVFIPLGEGYKSHRFIYIGSIEIDPETGREILKDIQVRTTEKIGLSYAIKELIFAKEGRKVEKTLRYNRRIKAIRLFQGYLLSSDQERNTFRRVDFTRGFMDLNLANRDEVLQAAKEGTDEVYMLSRAELEEQIMKYEGASLEKKMALLTRLKTEFHKRIALPMSIVLFSFLGFPMGIVNRRSGKGMGLGQSVGFIFLYFAVYLSSDSVAMVNPQVPPVLIAWMGNLIIFLIGLGIFLFKTTDFIYHPRVQAVLKKILPEK